jgi:hypothetical protein
LRIRTVVDARQDKPQSYLAATLLLAHSWAAQSRKCSFEVVIVGAAPSELTGRLRELGAELTHAPPHPLESVTTYANKLRGLVASEDGAVLLVDNDVCLLDDVSDLAGRKVQASLTFRARVSEAQWQRIAKTTGLRPLEEEWIPLSEELKAKQEGRAAQPVQRLYLNGGVVWVREPVGFAATWTAHNAAIAHAFDGHPLSDKWVRGLDEVSLVTAAAEHGGFDLLPLAYNYRPWCVRMGSLEPKILHLTRLCTVEQGPFSQALTAYWEQGPLKWLRRDVKRSPSEPGAEQEQLLDDAVSLRDRVLTLGAEADLDAFQWGR